MKKSFTRTLALLLCVIMLIGLVPVSALAAAEAEVAETVPAETAAEAPAEEVVESDAVIAAEEQVTYATGTTTYVLAGSDFQPTDGNNTTGVNLLNGILDKVDDKYTTMDGFIFAGDYDYNYKASQSGKEALQAAVQAVYGTGMDEVYIEGNHDDPDHGDNPDLIASGVFNQSGANDAEQYGVFVINHSDYMWYNSDEASIKNIAAKLESYLNAKRNAGYTKPIFVVSHLPLHYCMRTQVGGGDGKHANYIFDVLNEAGAAGLNIIFLFGHNHSHGWDDPYGGAAIFLKKGDNINIAQNSTTNYNVETLNFTYMNAGYVSYYRNVNSGAETDLSMTVFAITDTDVTIERYTADGLHDLKSAGVANTHASTGSSVDGSCSTNHGGTETYSPDTSVVASAYTLTLNTEITPAGEEVEVPDSGVTTTQRTYTRVTSLDELVSGDQYLIIHNGQNDFMIPVVTSDGGTRIGYDLVTGPSGLGNDTITGDYQEYEWTFTSVNGGWNIGSSAGYMTLQTSGTRVAAQLASSGDTMVIGGSANNFTFTSATYDDGSYVLNYNSTGDLINGYDSDAATFYIYRLTDEGSSTPTVETSGGNWVTITEPTEAGTKYVYELDTDGVDTGVEYLIVANSYEKALSAAASSNNAVDIEIDGNYAYADSDTYGWTFTSSSGNYQIRLNGSTYLRFQNYALSSSSSAGSGNNANQRRWSVSSNGDGSYAITSVSNSSYELRWSNSDGVFQASNSSEGPVRLYKYVKTETTTAQAGLYGMISGELTYNVAVGTSVEDAIQAVMDGIDILYHTGDESAAVTLTAEEEKTLITWTLDSSYDGSTPGEYAVTIAYNGVTLGVAKVVVPSVSISGYELSTNEATVEKDTKVDAEIGPIIVVTLENGSYYTVPVTVEMLSHPDGSSVSTAEQNEYTPLVLKYNGVTISENFTLNVVGKSGNNFPEYPADGSVKVSKTADASNLLSTGVVKVELSASGLPVKTGVDVVVVVDTSSSMDKDINGDSVSNGEKARIDILSDSLAVMLAQFQTEVDGVVPDIDLAVIDFNGYDNHLGSSYYIPGATLDSSTTYWRSAENLSEVYTGSTTGYIYDVDDPGDNNENVGLSAASFVPASSITSLVFTEDNTMSGTNYDDGLLNAYKLLQMKAEANGDEEREQYVIFLSDGAPYRYNGYNNSDSGYATWDKWLSGDWANSAAIDAEITPTDTLNKYSQFYAGQWDNDGDGSFDAQPHRAAEAIKGAVSEKFTVYNHASSSANDYAMELYGLDAKIYAIGFGLADDSNSNGANVLPEATMHELLKVISSETEYDDTQYYYPADSAEGLDTAFTQIAASIRHAAENARYVDQMGESFSLQMANSVVAKDENGNDTTVELDPAPVIEVKTYEIYSQADADADENDAITDDMVGKRADSGTLKELIAFSADGKQAYSSLIDVDKDGIYGVTVNADGSYAISDEDDNILGTNGVIYAKNFYYNSSAESLALEGVELPTVRNGDGTTGAETTNVLPPETFYWTMGIINEQELAVSYYVHLDGAMEGEKAAGSYQTNEFAILYYDNWLDNSVYYSTTSPQIGWKSANVSYAFYLVDDQGKPVVNQTTGETGSFYNAVKVTQPVIFQEIMLNTLEEINTIEASSLTILPEGYELYDTTASYKIVILSEDGKGSWTITYDPDKTQSSWVTGFSGTDASNDTYASSNETDTAGYDYTHTTVWFAVKWIPEAIPDTVVVDYGLPVDISVLANDQFGDNGELVALAKAGSYEDKYETLNGAFYITGADGLPAPVTALERGDASGLSYGSALINGSKVRYTPETMQMDSFDKFSYAVKYTVAESLSNSTSGIQYYYGEVRVVPATTIYYEDSFVSFTNGTGHETHGIWTSVQASGDTTDYSKTTQAEDRPGKYSLASIDRNNLYGYDAAYDKCTEYSLGSATMVTTSAANNPANPATHGTWPSASFTFTGSAFDIISLTSNDTGAISIDVYEGSDNTGTKLKSWYVDTYYGYSYTYAATTYTYTNGEWVAESVAVENTNQTSGTAPTDPAEGSTYVVYGNAWVAAPNDPNALYQVPIIKSSDLGYGTYTVEITIKYAKSIDHNSSTADFDFYMDSIRVYEPAGDADEVVYTQNGSNVTINDLYGMDGEAYPQFYELRNMLINAETFASTAVDDEAVVEGIVFIDGNSALGGTDAGTVTGNVISDYVNYGPNNEVYLAPGQAIVFTLNAPDAPEGFKLGSVQLAYKSVGGTAHARVWDATYGTVDTANERILATATDQYYSITHLDGKNIVIYNDGAEGDAIISVTNIKIAYAANNDSSSSSSSSSSGAIAEDYVFSVTLASAQEAVMSLGLVEEPEIPEVEDKPAAPSEPETFQPETFRIKLSERNVKLGKTIKLTITASDDVERIVVNGVDATEGKTDKRSGLTTWTVRIKAQDAGELTISAVAYDAKGVASEAVETSVSVTDKGSATGNNKRNIFD